MKSDFQLKVLNSDSNGAICAQFECIIKESGRNIHSLRKCNLVLKDVLVKPIKTCRLEENVD
jgi:hypothetical protein